MQEKIVQTAGREQLGAFSPLFAHLNDDVLFGEVWNDPTLSLKTKSIITVVSLAASGITDSSLTYHLNNAKKAGVTQQEAAAIITHMAMYVGWPKAWAVFRMAKDVWPVGSASGVSKEAYAAGLFLPIGEPNTAYAKYFSGQSFLAPITTGAVPMYNVTFAPSCRNNWHVHHAKSGGGQILLAVGGAGYYQEWGKAPIAMLPGTAVTIPAGVKHWHGAAPDSWFSHIAVEVKGEDSRNEWLEPVSDSEYAAATAPK